ncbi:hypothetical protein [Desulfolucanica intricata]|uniref:hypothetical protein n=1 Tax=Desulfolucanica intricata TaxID=1285191 RepID=UPI000ACC8451|nr:hypothetical protein [Desulfolucanica intricata]
MCPSNELNELMDHIMSQLSQGTGEFTQDVFNSFNKNYHKNDQNEKDKDKDNKN